MELSKTRAIIVVAVAAIAVVGFTIAGPMGAASASATTNMNDLSVDGDEIETPDGNLTDVTLLVEGEFAYEGLDERADHAVVTLHVCSCEDQQAVAQTVVELDGNFEGSGAYALEGSIINETTWTAADFAAGEDGGMAVTDLEAYITVSIRDASGNELARASDTDEFSITVHNQQSAAWVHGTGQAEAHDNRDYGPDD